MARLALVRPVMAALVVSVAGATAAPAFGQGEEAAPEAHHERRFAVGGEVTVIAGGREDTGFFNNTDYDINATRMARMRVFGEWRFTSDVSAVGELRSENGTHLITPSVYLRWRPASLDHLVVQAGRIPPVFGAFARRPYGRDNLTLGIPLAYQYLTSLRPDALPATIDDVLRMRGRGWQPSFPIGSTDVRGGVPLVSVSGWDTGAEAMWETDRVDVSAAVTRGSLAVPAVRDRNGGVTTSARVAVRGPVGLSLGASAAHGQWLEADVVRLAGGGGGASSQTTFGADVEVGSGPWLGRAEWIHATFAVPMAAASVPPRRLGAHSGFVEARYRFHPRWQIGARADRLSFGGVQSSTAAFTGGPPVPWDAPVTRVEGVLGLRAARNLEMRVGWQHNWRDGGRISRFGTPIAGAFYWF